MGSFLSDTSVKVQITEMISFPMNQNVQQQQQQQQSQKHTNFKVFLEW